MGKERNPLNELFETKIYICDGALRVIKICEKVYVLVVELQFETSRGVISEKEQYIKTAMTSVFAVLSKDT